MEENENATNETEVTEKDQGTVLTKKGIRLIAKILGSENILKISRVAVGTGSVPEGVEPREMEDLNCFKKDGKISRVRKVEGENQVNISMQVDSIGVDENFVITEAGIFAEDPDEGEILYGYLDMTDDPQLVYHSRNAISKMVEITMAIIVATMDRVDVAINPGSLVSIGDFEKFKLEIHNYCDTFIRNAIDDLQRQIGDLSKLRTESKCCLVDAINEIVEVIRPLTEYGYLTSQDVADIVAGIYSDDIDWMGPFDIVTERDIRAIVNGTYVPEPEDESFEIDGHGMMTHEDVVAIVNGTYVPDQEEEELVTKGNETEESGGEETTV